MHCSHATLTTPLATLVVKYNSQHKYLAGGRANLSANALGQGIFSSTYTVNHGNSQGRIFTEKQKRFLRILDLSKHIFLYFLQLRRHHVVCT